MARLLLRRVASNPSRTMAQSVRELERRFKDQAFRLYRYLTCVGHHTSVESWFSLDGVTGFSLYSCIGLTPCSSSEVSEAVRYISINPSA